MNSVLSGYSLRTLAALALAFATAALLPVSAQAGAIAPGNVFRDCKVQRLRGNDWGEAPVFSRSGNRNAAYADARGDWLGFRVARDL